MLQTPTVLTQIHMHLCLASPLLHHLPNHSYTSPLPTLCWQLGHPHPSAACVFPWSQLFTHGLADAGGRIESSRGPLVLALHIATCAMAAAAMQILLSPQPATITGPGMSVRSVTMTAVARFKITDCT